jgi:N-acyl-D-aspartate/D-glutamate deacylase
VSPRPQLHLVAEGSLEDRAREARILRLGRELEKAIRAGAMGLSKAIELQEQLRAEVAARSPAQVYRMERARGLCR